jgi:hypothetical protein
MTTLAAGFVTSTAVFFIYVAWLFWYPCTDVGVACSPHSWSASLLRNDSNLLAAFPAHFLDPRHPLTEVELDALYDSCDRADDAAASHVASLAVVVPFIGAQIPLLLASMRRWQRTAVPCGGAYRTAARCRPVDLVLLFHRVLNASATAQLRAVAPPCFRDVLVLNADLPDAMDVYGVGTVSMFYGLFSSKLLAERYRSVFLMEPDVVALRDDWLGELQRQAARDDFWVRGGMQRAPHFLERGFGADYSINGNALYRLGSPCFAALLERSRRLQSAGTPFDLSLRRMLDDPARFAEQQRVLHRIQIGDFIRNLGDGHTWSSVRELRERAPRTYLAHTKMFKDDDHEADAGDDSGFTASPPSSA